MQNTTMFLLAEDDLNDAYFVEQEFKRGPGHLQLRSVRDGAQAIEYMEGKGDFANRDRFPLPDVVLLDLKMPRVNGFEFLEWLRKDGPDTTRQIPVVVLTSSAETSDVHRAYELGATSYFLKPVNLHEFQGRIKELGSYWGKNLRAL